MIENKQSFQSLLNQLTAPLKTRYSPGKARLHLGDTATHYDPVAAEMEAFARPLWGLAPFWAGGGREDNFAAIYRKGLTSGTDPGHPEYWGGFTDCDQRFVEMAGLSCALMLATDVLWTPLAESAKKRVASWLNGINQYALPEGNWHFFRVLTNTALKRLGMPYDAGNIEESFSVLESHYLGNGWYMDGPSSHKDYYVSFAYHYYGLLYATFMKEEDPGRVQLFHQRATRFAQDFIYWFDEKGAGIPFGRSLTYRFAQVSFWGACVYAGVQPFPMGVMKGLICRNLAYWCRLPVTGHDGVLTIGYGYANLIMSESYNAPGSPYWALKAMLPLALPDNHPFWAAKCEPMPALDALKWLPEAEMLLSRRAEEVTVYVPGRYKQPGHGNTAEKYAKFAYSTRFGFSVPRSFRHLHEAAPDSMLAFVIDGSETVFTRDLSVSWELDEGSVRSTWTPFPGITVHTILTPMANGHIRRHEIESRPGCQAFDCGFAVPKDYTRDYAVVLEGRSASVQAAIGGCTIVGQGPGARPWLIEASPNTNLLYPSTCIPAIKYRIEPGRQTILESTVITFGKREQSAYSTLSK